MIMNSVVCGSILVSAAIIGETLHHCIFMFSSKFKPITLITEGALFRA